jgi:hypothetical protein
MQDLASVLLLVVLQSAKETDADGYKQAVSSAAQHASNGCTILQVLPEWTGVICASSDRHSF